MSKEEKYLKKISDLLTRYGIKDEEKEKFLSDLKESKVDVEEETTEESSTEEESKTEESTTENVGEGKDGSSEGESKEEVTETEEQSTETEEKEDSKTQSEEGEGSEEESKEKTEETETETESEEESTKGEETTETESEETKDGENEEGEGKDLSLEFQAFKEEVKKTNDGLSARLATLEDIVSKLGVEENKEDQIIGASSNGNPVDQKVESAFDSINRKRIGY